MQTPSTALSAAAVSAGPLSTNMPAAVVPPDTKIATEKAAARASVWRKASAMASAKASANASALDGHTRKYACVFTRTSFTRITRKPFSFTRKRFSYA